MPKQYVKLAGLLALLSLLMGACTGPPGRTAPPASATDRIAPTLVPPSHEPDQAVAPQPLWTYQTDGAIWGTALVSAGTVYIGSDDGHLYAVDSQTGELRWKFATQGLVRSRPAIANGLLFFSSDDGYLYAVDADSSMQAWKVDIDNASERDPRQNPGRLPEPTLFDYLQSSPVVSEAMVYVGSADGNVYALATTSGDILWAYKTGQKVRATPTLDNGTLYIGSWDGSIYALDARTGQLRWQTPIGGQVQSTVLATGEVIFTASRKASVVALDAQNGKKRWEYDYGKNMWVESSPQLINDLIYVGSSGTKYVVGLNRRSGELYTIYMGTSFFWSTPIIAEDMLYIGSEGFTEDNDIGGLYSFEIPTQINYENRSAMKLKWILPITETMAPDGLWAGVASSPVMSEGVIYFGGLDGKIYAVAP